MQTSVKERLVEFIKYTGISKNKFETICKLSTRYVSNISVSIQPDKIERISLNFPNLNMGWLLTGEGEMLRDTSHTPLKPELRSGNLIRYWVDIDATAGGIEMYTDTTSPNYIDISIPEFKDCTDAVNLYGDSMYPLYRSGQIIILKKWCESFIDFGNIYLIITKSGNRMVKYLRKGSDSSLVLCASENKDFDPFEINRDDILQLYIVKGGVAKNAL